MHARRRLLRRAPAGSAPPNASSVKCGAAKHVEQPHRLAARVGQPRIRRAVARPRHALSHRAALVERQRPAAIVEAELHVLALARLLLVLRLAEPVLVHLHDEFEQMRRDRQPLLLVAVEQRVGRAVAQHLAELPAEIVGVLHRGVHALPAGRRMHMRGVADQEHAADAEVLGETAARAEMRGVEHLA